MRVSQYPNGTAPRAILCSRTKSDFLQKSLIAYAFLSSPYLPGRYCGVPASLTTPAPTALWLTTYPRVPGRVRPAEIPLRRPQVAFKKSTERRLLMGILIDEFHRKRLLPRNRKNTNEWRRQNLRYVERWMGYVEAEYRLQEIRQLRQKH